MSVLYVDAISGADANSGASWALAKKTLSGANAVASAGDTIVCTGRFLETIPVKQLFWNGFGYCEFNGNGGSGANPAASTSFRNITFTGWLQGPFGNGNYNSTGLVTTAGIQFYDCIFRDMPCALSGGQSSGATAIFSRCLFYNLTTYAACAFNSNFFTFLGCVFFANTVDLYQYSGGTLTCRFCCFGSPIMINNQYASNLCNGNYNVFDFTNGKNIANAVDKTTLAAWQASTQGTTPGSESNSIDRVWRADVADYANRLLHSNPAGYLLTAGAPILNPTMGNPKPAIGISNNTNASLWTGGVFTNTQLDGSGYLVLSAGQTVGTWASDVVDLTTSTTLYNVNVVTSGEVYPTTYCSTNTTDSSAIPGLQMEIRGSDTVFLKGDVSPAWITMPRGAEIGGFVATNKFRYWQIRLTLRG